jgi:uncharacterized protein (TIGR00269 family)
MDADVTICDVCKHREAFFFRPYSGERLCRRCFTKSIEEKVRATISKYGMLRFDDKIAVAVSGGKDSISLLHILAIRERRFPRASLVAVTVDEGIKGYRDEALKTAAENCEKLEIEHRVVSFRELYGCALDEVVERFNRKAEHEATSCAFCGVLRRRALNLVARKVGANKIATAHTLDDEAQTILLNVFHGDVLRIAREKPVTDQVHPKLVQKIKPFCEIPEKETAMYAYLKKVKFQSKPCPYASEALRNDVRMMLNKVEEKHPGTKFTIVRSMERIRPALEEMDKKQGLTECSECGEATSERICRTCQMLAQMERTR